ncbi:MAG: hypothetical protein JO053_01735 [Acidobacteria bacterium]|nr:hypothetical protein [Acidobacteriota bacterium]
MPDTPLVIKAESRPDHLYIHVKTSRTTPYKMLEWMSELSLLAAESRQRRILVDRDIPNFVMSDSLAEAFERVVTSRSEMRFAIVNRHRGIGRQMKAALEAMNKLPPNVEFFNKVRDAEDWLTS